ncbi:MAG: hypothetical protein K8S25_04135 [Alphaproteobacteria bacterium]|nr:hypothetical protein [Alphaproteobacteria bacterium]
MLEVSNARPNVVVRDLFATPVLVCEWPDVVQLNAKLRAMILARRESSPGIVSSNRKGWHSESNLHRWNEGCIDDFLLMLNSAVSKMAAHMIPDAESKYLENWEIKSCWANVNPAGGSNRSHNHIHQGVLLSGFYYVDIGAVVHPEFAGRTILEDRSGVSQPCGLGHDLSSREYAIVPKPGVMVLFPSAQFHYVEPYRGEGVRISIAFNLGHPHLDYLSYETLREQGWWWSNFRGLMILKSKIPEKLHALWLFGSYFLEELSRPRAGMSLLKRIRITFDRASVDASDASDKSKNSGFADGALGKKRPLI